MEYSVVWEIDESGDNPISAAQSARACQEPDSEAITFDVYDSKNGIVTRVDLFEGTETVLLEQTTPLFMVAIEIIHGQHGENCRRMVSAENPEMAAKRAIEGQARGELEWMNNNCAYDLGGEIAITVKAPPKEISLRDVLTLRKYF